MMARGMDDIKDHPFFAEYDWNMVTAREITPPLMPKAGTRIPRRFLNLTIEFALLQRRAAMRWRPSGGDKPNYKYALNCFQKSLSISTWGNCAPAPR